MPQPNQGKPASSAPTQEPLMDKKMSAPKGGDVRFGYQAGGTRGSGKGAK